jgi:hypothetical protein
MDRSRGTRLQVRLAVLAVLVVLGAVAPAASASAHVVRAAITPPASAPPADSAFTIGFSGDTTSLPDGEGYVEARIRRGTRTPCAATELEDPGDGISFRPILSNRVIGAFSIAGSYVADTPGDYLVCAWIVNEYSESGPPVAATMTVRPPVLALTAAAPATATPGVPFDVTVGYDAEVPRYLSVLVVHASSCSVNARDLRRIVPAPIVVADGTVAVSGAGSLTARVRLDRAGTYLVCGFLDEYLMGSSAAELVVRAATVTVGRPAAVPGPRASRACGDVGGRRHIRNVRARAVSCTRARALARRWGRQRRAPLRLGAYRCVARSGRVTCSAGAAQVRFGFGHR